VTATLDVALTWHQDNLSPLAGRFIDVARRIASASYSRWNDRNRRAQTCNRRQRHAWLPPRACGCPTFQRTFTPPPSASLKVLGLPLFAFRICLGGKKLQGGRYLIYFSAVRVTKRLLRAKSGRSYRRNNADSDVRSNDRRPPPSLMTLSAATGGNSSRDAYSAPAH
jgi:hypothetical protein